MAVGEFAGLGINPGLTLLCHAKESRLELLHKKTGLAIGLSAALPLSLCSAWWVRSERWNQQETSRNVRGFGFDFPEPALGRAIQQPVNYARVFAGINSTKEVFAFFQSLDSELLPG